MRKESISLHTKQLGKLLTATGAQVANAVDALGLAEQQATYAKSLLIAAQVQIEEAYVLLENHNNTNQK